MWYFFSRAINQTFSSINLSMFMYKVFIQFYSFHISYCRELTNIKNMLFYIIHWISLNVIYLSNFIVSQAAADKRGESCEFYKLRCIENCAKIYAISDFADLFGNIFAISISFSILYNLMFSVISVIQWFILMVFLFFLVQNLKKVIFVL